MRYLTRLLVAAVLVLPLVARAHNVGQVRGVEVRQDGALVSSDCPLDLDAPAIGATKSGSKCVVALDPDLAFLAGMSTTGLMARTGAGTYAARSLSCAGPVVCTHTGGVAGNPTIELDSATTSSIWEVFVADETGSGGLWVFNLAPTLRGPVLISNAGTIAGIRLQEDNDNGAQFIEHQAQAAIGTSKTIIWPETYVDQEFLKANVSGNTITLSTTASLSGSGVAGRLAYWTGTSAIDDDADLLYDATLNRVSTGALFVGGAITSSFAGTGTISISADHTTVTCDTTCDFTGPIQVGDTIGIGTPPTEKTAVVTTIVGDTTMTLRKPGIFPRQTGVVTWRVLRPPIWMADPNTKQRFIVTAHGSAGVMQRNSCGLTEFCDPHATWGVAQDDLGSHASESVDNFEIRRVTGGDGSSLSADAAGNSVAGGGGNDIATLGGGGTAIGDDIGGQGALREYGTGPGGDLTSGLSGGRGGHSGGWTDTIADAGDVISGSGGDGGDAGAGVWNGGQGGNAQGAGVPGDGTVFRFNPGKRGTGGGGGGVDGYVEITGPTTINVAGRAIRTFGSRTLGTDGISWFQFQALDTLTTAAAYTSGATGGFHDGTTIRGDAATGSMFPHKGLLAAPVLIAPTGATIGNAVVSYGIDLTPTLSVEGTGIFNAFALGGMRMRFDLPSAASDFTNSTLAYLKLAAPTGNTAGVTAVTGIDIESQPGVAAAIIVQGTDDYVAFGGPLRVGASSPPCASCAAQFGPNSKAVQLTAPTNAQLGGLTNAVGMIAYAADAETMAFYDDDTGVTAWRAMGAGKVPVFRSVGTLGNGTGTVGSGQGLGLPAGQLANDILLLAIRTENQAGTCPTGYAQVGPQNGTGAAGNAAATRLTLCWKRSVGGGETIPTVADSGDSTTVVIMAFSDATTVGDPFRFLSAGFKAATSTSLTATGGRTDMDKSLVVAVAVHDIDSTSAQLSSAANTSLTNVVEQVDVSSDSGAADGGGIVAITGTLALAGLVGNTTGTWAATSLDAWTTIALIPASGQTASPEMRQTDVQVFRVPGANTWTKPSGAKMVEVIAIGGGGAGGAGNTGGTATGGGGGGGGAYQRAIFVADELEATLGVTVGAAGVGGSTKSAATASTVTDNALTVVQAGLGVIGVDGANNNGGDGGAGGSGKTLAVNACTTPCNGNQGLGSQGGDNGKNATTQQSGGKGDQGGGGGGAGTPGATAGGAGATSNYGGGGGGGATVSGTPGSGGVGGGGAAGGGDGAAGAASGSLVLGGSGGGGSSTGTGGGGGYPGGAGGGGSGDGTNNGGSGSDGVVVITTYF